MSLIWKCDICGKDSSMTNVTFCRAPIMAELENYHGEKFIAFYHVQIQNKKDYDKILKIQKEASSNIFGMPSETSFKLNTAMPLMCDNCKFESLLNAYEEGTISELANEHEINNLSQLTPKDKSMVDEAYAILKRLADESIDPEEFPGNNGDLTEEDIDWDDDEDSDLEGEEWKLK
jgi:hypothetical protein